jgi:hypothetical protein
MISMFQLKDEYIKKIYGDTELQGRIAKVCKVQVWSVLHWCKENHETLTKYSVLYTIAEHCKIHGVDSLVKLNGSDKRKKNDTTAKGTK